MYLSCFLFKSINYIVGKPFSIKRYTISNTNHRPNLYIECSYVHMYAFILCVFVCVCMCVWVCGGWGGCVCVCVCFHVSMFPCFSIV